MVKLGTAAVKTVLAALVAVAALTVPASASESSLTPRGVDKAPATQAAAPAEQATVWVAEATPARKVRVVLASPYGD